jgi:hypothetical protein
MQWKKEDVSGQMELTQWLRTPAPRRLTPSLRKQVGKVPGSWFLVLFGLIFVAAGSFFCAMFLPWKMWQEMSLDRAKPRMVAGMVTRSEATNMSINDAQVWRHEVTFQDGGEAVVSVGYTTGKTCSEGEQVKVRVHPEDGALHCPERMRMTKGSLGSAFVLLFPAVGLLVMLSPWFTRRSRFALYEKGLVADIRVLDVQATNVQVNHRTVHKITVRYPTLTEPIVLKISDVDQVLSLSEAHQTGEPLRVIYNPKKPKRLEIL